MRTITYNPETHVLVPRDLIADAKQIFCSDVEPNTNGDCLDVIEWFNAMMAVVPQPANDEVVFIDGVGAGRSSIKSCRDGVQWIIVVNRVYWPLSDSDAKRLQSACCGNGHFDGPATPTSEGERQMTDRYEKIRRVAARAVSWARPVYATEPAEAWEAGDLVDVEFYNHPEKPEGEGWRPLVFADTGDTARAAEGD